MKISIIAVGRIKEKYLKDAVSEYSKRLSRYCKLAILEAEDEQTPDKASEALREQIKEKEAKRIFHHIAQDSYVIALDIKGQKLDSEGFAGHLKELTVRGHSHVQFIIGGSLGLHPSVLARADYLLSFSDLTFPHQLMRVILLEQTYRGCRINAGEPYHK